MLALLAVLVLLAFAFASQCQQCAKLCLLAPQPACAACSCLAVTVDPCQSQYGHLQDRPFSYLWAEGGAQPKLEANFGVGGASFGLDRLPKVLLWLAAEASFCCGAPSTQCQPFSCAPCSRLLAMPQAMATPCSSSKHNTCAMQKVLKHAPFKCRRLRLPRAHRLQPGQGQVRHQQVSEMARGVVPAALNLCRCCGIAASG